jgi:subtilisin family serine protease
VILGCFADPVPSPQYITNNSSSVSTAEISSHNEQVIIQSSYRQNDQLATLNTNIQATVLADESTLGLSGIQLVKIPNDTTIDTAIQYYSNNSNVEYVQPDYIYQACDASEAMSVSLVTDNFSNYRSQRRDSGFMSSNNSSPTFSSQMMNVVLGNNSTSSASWPNDPYYSYQWDMQKMAAPDVWVVSTGSSSVTVAVVDTGVDYTHPDLAANYVSGYDFVNNDANPMDDNGHGTHCAGTIAAIGNNGVGIAGVTWNSKIMPLKFLDSGGHGYTSDALNTFAWGYSRGVRIFSNSWGRLRNGYSAPICDKYVF